MRINNAADAKKAIGTILYWDDIGARYIMLRFGKLNAVDGKNLDIDGDWKWRPHLRNLRTTKEDE
jgi:hypothetical protein